jgi:cold shock protein
LSKRDFRRRAAQEADDYTAIDRLLGDKGNRTASPTPRQMGKLISGRFDERGFDFIKPDDGGKDIFVGIGQLRLSGIGRLVEGDRVSFQTEINPKNNRPQAVKIELIGP